MLYSELIERQSRFKLALKIAFPFLLFLTLFIIIFKVLDIQNNDFILIIFLTFVYIYYILYMIYVGFRVSLLDNYTKAFNSYGIIKEIKKTLHSKKNSGFISMLFIDNLSLIEEQYGVDVRNKILKQFIKQLDSYLIKNGFKDTPIGKYQSGTFLLLFKNKKSKKEIEHVLIGFCKEIENGGIFTIEIKMDYSIISLSYDKNIKNIISKLINLPKERENNLNILIKPDEFDTLVKKAAEAQNFIISYQGVYALKDVDENPLFYNTNIKIYIDNYGTLAQNQITQSVNKNGYEIKFDYWVIKTILTETKTLLRENPNIKIIIKISLVSFRNRVFLIKIKELLKECEVEAENIAFSLNEKSVYSDMQRFKETIKEYKSLGFYLIFDEFGFNNVGLVYLKDELGFDMISFDIELTKYIDKNSYYQLLRSFIELSKSLHIKSLVKFVDKRKSKEIFEELNPDFVQGYLFDKPKLANEI